ncbi:MAG: hypothetical protein HQ500_03180, partial [Flavobacteriales bacterium]|nr:hypothetical protein [Flavobacteriales bacterium]
MSRLSSLWRTASLLFLLFITFSINVLAQSPQGINYQAVARNADGEPFADTTLDVTITLAQNASLSTTQYIEVHSVQTNTYGLFSLIIGDGTPTLGTFLDVTWETGTVFLNVQIGSLDMGTTQMMSVPYALFAESSDDGDWGINDSTVFTNKKVGIGTDQPIADLDMFLTGQSAYAAFSGSGDGNNYAGMLLGAAGQNRRWNVLHRQDAATQNGLMFEYFDGTTYYSRLFIDRFGKVGIGNDDPQALLDVSGLTEVDSLSINGAYRFPSIDGAAGQVLVTDGGGNVLWQAMSDSLQGFELVDDTTLRITEGGGQAYDLNISVLATDQELQTIVNLLTNTIDSIAAQVAINQDSISLLNDSMLAMQADIAANSADIQENVDSIAAAQADIAANSTNIQTNADSIAAAQADIATNIANIQENTDSIAAAQADIAANASNIQTNSDSIAAAQADIATNIANIQENTDSIAAAQADIAANTTNIQTNSDSIAAAQADIAANIAIIQENADSIAAAQADIAANTTNIQTNS